MGVSKFSSEVRERSVQLVLEQEAQHKSQWHGDVCCPEAGLADGLGGTRVPRRMP